MSVGTKGVCEKCRRTTELADGICRKCTDYIDRDLENIGSMSKESLIRAVKDILSEERMGHQS